MTDEPDTETRFFPGQRRQAADPFGDRAELVNRVRLAKSAAALEPLRC